MKLVQHAKYSDYARAHRNDRLCRRAIADWQVSGGPIKAETYSLSWTPESTRAFIRSLSRMFCAYNRVLWETFPYCRQCGGRCCTTNASYLTMLDPIATVLLDQSLPTLPEEIAATAQDCIYRTTRGCIWPANWRPPVCWAYYCLGRGEGRPTDSLRERYDVVGEKLEPVVLDLLPTELRQYERVHGDPFSTYLGEPLDFVEVLNDALFEVFLAPFNDRYAVIDVGTVESVGFCLEGNRDQ